MAQQQDVCVLADTKRNTVLLHVHACGNEEEKTVNLLLEKTIQQKDVCV